MSPNKCLHLSILLLTGSAIAAQPLQSQSTPPPLTRTQFGIGYAGNAPDALLGGSAYVLVPKLGGLEGGIGLYVDFKMGLGSPEDDREFNPDVTVQELLGDPNRETADFVKEESYFTSVNLGIVRPITPFLMAYVGGGITRLTRYEMFNLDLYDPVGVGGLVVVENPERDATRPNFMAGVFMRLSSHVSTQFGIETQPQGLTVGASLRLPPW